MLPIHRPQLIQDLSDTALGLIRESENIDPQDARALVDLAGTLDKLRVKMIADTNSAQRQTRAPQWVNNKRH